VARMPLFQRALPFRGDFEKVRRTVREGLGPLGFQVERDEASEIELTSPGLLEEGAKALRAATRLRLFRKEDSEGGRRLAIEAELGGIRQIAARRLRRPLYPTLLFLVLVLVQAVRAWRSEGTTFGLLGSLFVTGFATSLSVWVGMRVSSPYYVGQMRAASEESMSRLLRELVQEGSGRALPQADNKAASGE